MQDSIYNKRRSALLERVEDGSVIILAAATMQRRSNDTEYPYRQESNFYYLSGLLEESAYIILTKKNTTCKSYLFVQKKDPELELWSGKRVGLERAKELFSFDEFYESEFFYEELEKILVGFRSIYCDLFEDERLFSELRELVKKLRQKREIRVAPSHFIDVRELIGAMRLIKSSEEIALITQAIHITKEAHHNAMKRVVPEMFEYQLQAEYEFIFKKLGAYSDAYTTIVAGGENANTLHYIDNAEPLKDGALVLVDAGCEYKMYASDITRTFPVNGVFSQAQKELYEMVLDVQLKVIEYVKPGVTKSELQHYSEKLLTEGMLRLGILQGDLEELMESKAHKRYYPHGIGHWLGLDVHDVCPYYEGEEEIAFAAGMVLTIEPGIYLPKDCKEIPQKYRAIGIRIEDNILVTESGNRNLSADIVKSVEEIEKMMQKA